MPMIEPWQNLLPSVAVAKSCCASCHDEIMRAMMATMRASNERRSLGSSPMAELRARVFQHQADLGVLILHRRGPVLRTVQVVALRVLQLGCRPEVWPKYEKSSAIVKDRAESEGDTDRHRPAQRKINPRVPLFHCTHHLHKKKALLHRLNRSTIRLHNLHIKGEIHS